MPFDWTTLRDPAPKTLAAARALAHRAAQWPTRAARANLDAAPDDSHTALAWDERLGALVSETMPGGATVGLRVASLELQFKSEKFSLPGRTEAEADAWLDAQLARAGLKAASGAALPYEVPAVDFACAAGEAAGLRALAGWFAAAAELLEAQRAKWRRFKPGPSPVRCWPHHFDIAVLVGLEVGHAETARSIGVGVSPGDGYYDEPYAYLSPYPRPDPGVENSNLPALPPGGRWHTKDFFAAVATGSDLVAAADPRAALAAIIDAGFEFGLAAPAAKP
ncbi:MAG: hypothetical protein ABI654_14290 [Betaproteobacteria bacterium]